MDDHSGANIVMGLRSRALLAFSICQISGTIQEPKWKSWFIPYQRLRADPHLDIKARHEPTVGRPSFLRKKIFTPGRFGHGIPANQIAIPVSEAVTMVVTDFDAAT